MEQIKYKVVEIFNSINGEGPKAGQLAVFIRLQGCNLRCSYCDTMWANEADAPYTAMTQEEILAKIKESGISNVTLTGGEPLWGEDKLPLVQAIAEAGYPLEIETNGSIPIREYAEINPRPAFTLDYKLPSSGMDAQMLDDNYVYLAPQDTVKFVIGTKEDMREAARVVKAYELTSKCHVYFSPVFHQIEPKEIIEFMKEEKLNGVNFQLQIHKYVWPPEQRGV